MNNKMILDNLIERFPKLSLCTKDIKASYLLLEKCFLADKRLYICGNGGSAADALHIVGELTKSFTIKRKLDDKFIENTKNTDLSANLQGALPAIALVENTALSTAFSNDCSADYVFAQQVYAYAREGDCVLGISTSGNANNVIHALNTAKGRGAITLGLSGETGGKIKAVCDVCICVPETEVYKVQEMHVPVYHALCLMLEQRFFGD